jgi:GNAT superfamily N-acetyltransferase
MPTLNPDTTPAGDIRIQTYRGSRDDLRPLFELAEDSAAELDSYIGAGRVLVAISGPEVIGHLQLTGTGDPRQAEIKNMAVREARQGHGIGRRLIQAAIGLLAAEGVTTLLVATAAADIGNLRFYQRQGFRMRSIERDAFTPPPDIRPACASTASNYGTGNGSTSSSAPHHPARTRRDRQQQLTVLIAGTLTKPASPGSGSRDEAAPQPEPTGTSNETIRSARISWNHRRANDAADAEAAGAPDLCHRRPEGRARGGITDV